MPTKIIKHKARGIDTNDFPMEWKLTVILKPMFSFTEEEEIIVRGDTREELRQFAKVHRYTDHPRLISLRYERTA